MSVSNRVFHISSALRFVEMTPMLKTYSSFQHCFANPYGIRTFQQTLFFKRLWYGIVSLVIIVVDPKK